MEPKALSGLDAAAQILREAGEPMNAQDLIAQILERGLWKTEGKTPAATIYAAMSREIKAKGTGSRFQKVAAERVEDDAGRRAGVLDQVEEQRHRLHGRVLAVPARLVELQHRGLAAIGEPGVAGAVLPAVEAGLVLPLVVLPAEHQGGLHPDQALPHGQPDVGAGPADGQTLRVGMPAVERTARPQHRDRAPEGGDQELPVGGVVHVIVGVPVHPRLGCCAEYPQGLVASTLASQRESPAQGRPHIQVWPVAARTAAEAEAGIGTVIISEIKEFTPATKTDLTVAGKPARRLSGTSVEADDGDPGNAEVTIFTIGAQVFVLVSHGEGSGVSDCHDDLMKLLAANTAL